MSKSRDLIIRNTSNRMLVIGPSPKSGIGSDGKEVPKRGLIKFDTSLDDVVDDARRIGKSHTVKGEIAEALRSNRVLKEVGERVGLRTG